MDRRHPYWLDSKPAMPTMTLGDSPAKSPAAIRQEILAATLLSPERSWYLSELAAHLKTSPSGLQRELEALAASDILQRRQEAGKKAVVPTTEQKLLPPSSRNSATCFRKRQGWFLCCRPSSMDLGTRSRGPRSTARLPEVRSTRKATSIC